MLILGSNPALGKVANFCKIAPQGSDLPEYAKGIWEQGVSLRPIKLLDTWRPKDTSFEMAIDPDKSESYEWHPFVYEPKASVYEYEPVGYDDAFHAQVTSLIPKFTWIPKRKMSVEALFYALTTGNTSCLSGSEAVKVGEYSHDLNSGAWVNV